MHTEEDFDRAVLRTLLDASSDQQNPSVDDIYEIVRRTELIAVVGMSKDPTKAARQVPSYLAAKGAELIPVNPTAERILARQARASLDDVPEAVDLVQVFRPSHEAGAIVAQAAARPERPVIWLQEGILANEAVAAARAKGLTVVQDLCLYKVHRAFGDTLRRAKGRNPLAE